MKLSRRSFLKRSLSAGAGIMIIPSLSCGRNKKSAFLKKLGICTGVSNYMILKNAGYSYIEDSVQGFLVPLAEESTFNEKLAILQSSEMIMPALNSFIPGKLRSVGPEAVHDEILKYVETAFRRAQITGVKHIVFGSSGSRKVPEGFSRDEALNQFTELCQIGRASCRERG